MSNNKLANPRKRGGGGERFEAENQTSYRPREVDTEDRIGRA